MVKAVEFNEEVTKQVRNFAETGRKYKVSRPTISILKNWSNQA